MENARKFFPERKGICPPYGIGPAARHRASQDRITGCLPPPPRERPGRSLGDEAIPVRGFYRASNTHKLFRVP